MIWSEFIGKFVHVVVRRHHRDRSHIGIFVEYSSNEVCLLNYYNMKRLWIPKPCHYYDEINFCLVEEKLEA